MADRQGDTKTDLTRIDQLPEMEHHDDPEIDQLFAEQAAAESTGQFSVLESEAPPEVQQEAETSADADNDGANPFAFQESESESESESGSESESENENETAEENLQEGAAPLESAPDDASILNFTETDASSNESSDDGQPDPLSFHEDFSEASSSTAIIDNDQTTESASETNPAWEDNDDFNLDPLPSENPPPLAEEEDLGATAEQETLEESPADTTPDEEATFSAAAETTTASLADVAATPAPATPTAEAPSAPPAASPAETFPRMQVEKINLPGPTPRPAEAKASSLQDFASSVFPANASSVAPAYSLKLEDIDPDQQDAIMAIIREAKIYAPADEALLAQSLASGRLLIAHLSEYMAVTLAHQLRRLTGKLTWGLAQDVHPSPSYAPEENRGHARSSLPGQNHAQTFDAQQVVRDLNSIILTTAPQVAGHQIKQYLDIITEQAFLHAAQLGPQASDLLKYPEDEKIDISEEIASWDIYRDLTSRLRQKALAAEADAIINLNFVLHPIFLDSGERGHHLTVTGNLVTLAPLP